MKKMLGIIAAMVLGIALNCDAENLIRYDGSALIGKLLMPKAAAEYEKIESIKFDIKYKTTGYGIGQVAKGECDIAGGARPLEENEKALGLIQTEICLDAFAFIVHPSNPLEKITSEEISDILKGKITKWENVGGLKDSEITIISPPTDAAYYVTIQKMTEFEKLPQNAIQVSMTTEVYDKVLTQPTSLGIVSHADILNKAEVKLLTILHLGKQAKINQTHLTLGNYPYKQTLYFFTKGEPSETVKKFFEFFKTSKGKQVILESGFFFLPQK